MVVVLNQVSRDKSLKLPKKLEIETEKLQTVDEEVMIKKSIATATNERFNYEKVKEEIEKRDSDLRFIEKLPSNSSELMVITVVKKLCAYINVVTEKSPKKFRNVYVNRMQNHALDVLENLLQANFIRMNSDNKKRARENYQQTAIVKLKMLGYISMLAESVGCILPKQYKQISVQVAESINLIAAWKKSDDSRYKINGF